MSNMRDYNKNLISEFRANGGITAGRFQDKLLLLLTTTGAKTGADRTVPLVYLLDGNRHIIFASKGGSPNNPDWYHNIRVNSMVTVEVEGERFSARASITSGAERDSLYAKQVQVEPIFGQYQKSTSRVIPVIVLTKIH